MPNHLQGHQKEEHWMEYLQLHVLIAQKDLPFIHEGVLLVTPIV